MYDSFNVNVIETPLAGSVRPDNNSFTSFIPSHDQESSKIKIKIKIKMVRGVSDAGWI